MPAQEVRGYDGAVRVSCDDDAVESMGVQYACDRRAHRVARKRRGSDVHRDGHDFYSDEADVWILLREFAEERDVGQQTDADAVDEEDWEFSVRAVRTIPVGHIGLSVRGCARE